MNRAPLPTLLGASGLLGLALACGSPTPSEAPQASDTPVPVEPEAPSEPSRPKQGGTRLGVLPPAVKALPPLTVSKGVPLAALVATSGPASPLMDGDRQTFWKPMGDPVGEGVLLRFEAPTEVSQLKLHTCGTGTIELALFRDGVEDDEPLTVNLDEAPITIGGTVRSLFFKVLYWEPESCLADVSFPGQAISAPRFVSGQLKASSTLEPVAAYSPDYLVDSRIDFGWVEGKPDLGVGETVALQLTEPLELHAIDLWNGYQRSPDHFTKNARAKRVRIVLDGDRSFELAVPDEMGPSHLPLPEPVTTQNVELQILEVTPGTRYQDLVLSELRLWDAAGPVALQVSTQRLQEFGLYTRVRGMALEGMLNQQLLSVCAPTIRQLKLRSNHSFVWYDQPSRGQGEVFDGTWARKEDGDAATQPLQLFGRRLLLETDWSPYGTGTSQRITIAGGSPVLQRLARLPRAEAEAKLALVRKTDGRDCAMDLDELIAKDAVVITGDAITDVLVRRVAPE